MFGNSVHYARRVVSMVTKILYAMCVIVCTSKLYAALTLGPNWSTIYHMPRVWHGNWNGPTTCPPGFYYNGGVCQLCPIPDYYCDGNSGPAPGERNYCYTELSQYYQDHGQQDPVDWIEDAVNTGWQFFAYGELDADYPAAQCIASIPCADLGVEKPQWECACPNQNIYRVYINENGDYYEFMDNPNDVCPGYCPPGYYYDYNNDECALCIPGFYCDGMIDSDPQEEEIVPCYEELTGYYQDFLYSMLRPTNQTAIDSIVDQIDNWINNGGTSMAAQSAIGNGLAGGEQCLLAMDCETYGQYPYANNSITSQCECGEQMVYHVIYGTNGEYHEFLQDSSEVCTTATYSVTYSNAQCPNPSYSSTSTTVTVNSGSSITLPNNSNVNGTAFNCAGFSFDGWRVGTNGNTYYAGYSYTPNGNVTLYAQWTPNCVRVLFDSTTNGGSGGPSVLYKLAGSTAWYSNSGCSTQITNIGQLPTKTGAAYTGYYTTTTSGGVNVCDNYGTLSTSWITYGGQTVYARYTTGNYVHLYNTCVLDFSSTAGPISQSYPGTLPQISSITPWATCTSGSGNNATFMGWCRQYGTSTLYGELPGTSYYAANTKYYAIWCPAVNDLKCIDGNLNVNSTTHLATNAELIATTNLTNDASVRNAICLNQFGVSQSVTGLTNARGCYYINECNVGYRLSTTPDGVNSRSINKTATSGFTYSALLQLGWMGDNSAGCSTCVACTYAARNHSNTNPLSALPANAHWTTPGDANGICDWECDDGYVLNDAGTACIQSVAHTVTYNCGAGTGTPPTSHTGLYYGNTFTARTNTCTPPDYSEFVGWNYSGNNTTYNEGATVTFNSTSDQTMTAQYNECAVKIDWNSGVINSSASTGANGNGTTSFDSSLFGGPGNDYTFYLPAGTVVNNSNSTFTSYQFSCTGTTCTYHPNGANPTNNGFIMPAFTWSANGYIPAAWICVLENDDIYYILQPGDNASNLYYHANNHSCLNSNHITCMPLWVPLCATGNYSLDSSIINPSPTYHSATSHSYSSPYLTPQRIGPLPLGLAESAAASAAYTTWCDAGYSISSGNGTACPVCTQCAAGTYDNQNGYGTSCQICPNNYWSNAGATQCRACNVENGYVNGVVDDWHGPDASYHAGANSCKTVCTCGTRVWAPEHPCEPTGTNTYALTHSVNYGAYNSTLNTDFFNCGYKLYSIGFGAGADDSNDCGKILHTQRQNGSDYPYYLRQNRQLPSGSLDANSNPVKLLKMEYNNTEWCADLTTVPNDNLRIGLSGLTYYLYTPQCVWKPKISAMATQQACQIHWPFYSNGTLDTSDYRNWAIVSSSWRVDISFSATANQTRTLHGMSACLENGDIYSTYSVLPLEQGLNSDAYTGLKSCWCKTVNPMFSMWVKPDPTLAQQIKDCRFTTDVECRAYCPLLCALSMINDTAFQTAILTNIVTGTNNYSPQDQVSSDDWRDLYNVPFGTTWY